jgi:hypothetical protein
MPMAIMLLVAMVLPFVTKKPVLATSTVAAAT